MRVLGIREIPINKIEIIQGLLPRVETHTVEDKVEEYKEAMGLGSEFPPITVWQKGDEYWLIDGMHRLMASKRLGRTTIKAEVVELKDMLEAEILAITKNRHGMPLTKEEKRLLCQNLYSKNVEIPELQKIFGVSERTIYNWTSGLKRREKPEDIKEKALEMRKQGYTQEEVARELGIYQGTISKWEKDELFQPAKIADWNKNPSEEEPEEEIEEIEEPEEIKDPLFIKIREYARSKGMPEEVARKWYENINKEDEDDEDDEFIRQKREEFQQKRSYGGRPPNDPPPATEEELYNELKDTLLTHIYQIALKIGWEKTFKLLDEARERAIEVSKSAKRGW